jgi:glycosyltransferase involved in cell wall biosynthesis
VPRLGIYVDDVYRVSSSGSVSVDRAFLLFACEVGRRYGSVTVLGRAIDSDDPADYELPAVDLVPLPHYDDLKHASTTVAAAWGTAREMWRGLAGLDTVWVFGPHPFGFILVALALLRGKAVVLGVRQDTIAYGRARLGSGVGARIKLRLVKAMDAAFRLLSRRIRTTAVGQELARHYGPRALAMTVSLLPAGALAAGPRPLGGQPHQLLVVGRLETEKNPLLVVEMMAELERRRPGGQRLKWIGRGQLEAEVRARADALGVTHLIDLVGYVPFGEPLLDLYRAADAFVHISFTEGVPQVLIEAFGSGTPVVATAVGGVPRATGNGKAALLVPAGDLIAVVEAVERVLSDETLRERLAEEGLALARQLTIEAESARVAAYLA